MTISGKPQDYRSKIGGKSEPQDDSTVGKEVAPQHATRRLGTQSVEQLNDTDDPNSGSFMMALRHGQGSSGIGDDAGSASSTAPTAVEMQGATPRLSPDATAARTIAKALLEAEHVLLEAGGDKGVAHLGLLANAYREAVDAAVATTGTADDNSIREQLEKQSEAAALKIEQLKREMRQEFGGIFDSSRAAAVVASRAQKQEQIDALNDIKSNADTLAAMFDAANDLPRQLPEQQDIAGSVQNPPLANDVAAIIGPYAGSNETATQHLTVVEPRLAVDASKSRDVTSKLLKEENIAQNAGHSRRATHLALMAGIYRGIVLDVVENAFQAENDKANDDAIVEQIKHRKKKAEELSARLTQQREEAAKSGDGDLLIATLQKQSDMLPVHRSLDELLALFEQDKG